MIIMVFIITACSVSTAVGLNVGCSVGFVVGLNIGLDVDAVALKTVALCNGTSDMLSKNIVVFSTDMKKDVTSVVFLEGQSLLITVVLYHKAPKPDLAGHPFTPSR